MLLKDYVLIILKGLYNSPYFLVNHFKRELKKVRAKGYNDEEFEKDIREALTIIKSQIEEIYSKNLFKYEKENEKKRSLNHNKKYYPKPQIEEISISIIKIPIEGWTYHLPKAIFLNDLKETEVALDKIFKKATQNIYSDLYFTEPLNKTLYLDRYAEDKKILKTLEEGFKNANSEVSLNTSLRDLFKIYEIIEKWNGILADRLKIAPSRELAIGLFKKELENIIKHNEEGLEIDSEKYWNKIRKVAYEYYSKGQNVTLQGLGFLFLRNVYTELEGKKVLKNISIIYDTEGVLLSLAEGAALSEYLHSNRNNKLGKASHREVIFAHNFKVETDEARFRTAAEWHKERGGRSKIEYSTTIKKKNSEKYKEPSEKELEKIIELLEGFKAQKIAINKLDHLKN